MDIIKLALDNAELKKRIEVLQDLLSSSYNIANRNGEQTHWQRFAGQLHVNGISPVTPKTFKILPSDTEYAQSAQPTPSQSVVDERETGANATMAFGDWWMGEGGRGIEPANMSLVDKAFRAGWQARAQLNTKPTNNDALDAERWRYFYNNAQTALMLGSNLDPNNDSIDWLEECNRLADSAMKEVK